MNLSEALDTFTEYLQEQKRSPSTITAYKKDIEQLNKYLSDKEKLTDITIIEIDHLNSYIKYLKDDESINYTLKTISRKINSMKTFFKHLYTQGIISSDPAQQVKHPKYRVSPPRILSKLEYRALRDVARYNPRLYSIVELLLQTGIRIGELTRLTIDDVCIENPKKCLMIRTYASNPKREVELNDPAEHALKIYIAMRPQPKKDIRTLFLTKNGNSLLVRNVRTSISRAFEKAGIDNATVNDIRNTFIIHQLRSGMAIERVAEIVGHKRLTSTKKYARMIENKPKRKINKIVPL